MVGAGPNLWGGRQRRADDMGAAHVPLAKFSHVANLKTHWETSSKVAVCPLTLSLEAFLVKGRKGGGVLGGNPGVSRAQYACISI